MTTDGMYNDSLQGLLHERGALTDSDPDFAFRMRGNSLNPVTDAATPLFGMVARVRTLTRHEDVAGLWQTVATEIRAIEQELREHGYENGALLSFRYVLCSFIDEAVMAHEWGSQSVWAENSLLSAFHGETWGGEKVFAVLDKLREDPTRYRDVLEFILLCLLMGFQGRYRLMPDGQKTLREISQSLHLQLNPEPVTQPPVLHLDFGQQAAPYRLSRQVSLRTVAIVAGLLMAALFGIFHHLLSNQTQDVLRQLGELLT
ncbi:type IVB secretion system protein IcmH/DotU [Enterobacter ludwigii]|uniref:type IVB secretion system protein IcmH/DotU n=1 Tax=Enterobacter ludwigii TaxID=299767 RepID=UPI000F90B569